ncbi:hypothetical protein ACQKDS_08735 [Serratia sp. NPDC078593]
MTAVLAMRRYPDNWFDVGSRVSAPTTLLLPQLIGYTRPAR